ncbi:MAG TPA: cytochrome b [Casimicrobiaceae bacterium]|nr:cytochrome b [Casimicrobiaceae bacterium]
MSRSDRYTTPAVLLHWLIAALVLAQVLWGWWMQEIPKQPVGPRVDAYNLHKSVGLVIFALMVMRLAWRLTHRPPAFPAMPHWQERLAHATHALIYVALFVMPIAGYLGSVFSGYPVKWFGITLPSWAPRVDALKDAMSVLHLVTSIVLVAALVLHLAGATKHMLARDGLVGRMSLRRRAQQPFKPAASPLRAP